MKTMILLIGVVASMPCWAALGGQASLSGPTVQSRAATTTTGASYADLQTTLPNGTVVHEYADAGGTVFAVSWSGPFQPDLKALLGEDWFQVFSAQAAKLKGRGHSRMEVRDADLVVVSSGRMGAFQGRAWLVSRLPDGFSLEALR
jgi:hypothetical protein